jgi:hypothetical protein
MKYHIFTPLVLLSNFLFAQRVGINADAPETSLDIDGDLALRVAALALVGGPCEDIKK